MKIASIHARQILDSRGTPTVEADVVLESGVMGRASVPSGASTGIHEAVELRDGGAAFGGLGVRDAVMFCNGEINERLHGVAADDQFLIDDMLCALDGTEGKSRLGANATLAVSLACAHAAAQERSLPLYRHINDIAHGPAMSLPLPMINVLNGGKHAVGSSDFQEFMITPLRAKSYAHAVQISVEVFQALKKEVIATTGSSAVGDEGGFSFPVTSNEAMLKLLNRASRSAGYTPGEDILFAMDIAASELYSNGVYTLACEGLKLSTEQMIAKLRELVAKYSLYSIEDGLAEDDWNGWTLLQKALPNLQLVGDDLLVTNIRRLQQAIDMKAGNSILIKPNQVGTLTETIRAIQLAKQHGWNTVVSHRSGETEDVSIAHIAVGTGAGQIKTGSVSRTDRNAKHNELMRIEEMDATLELHQL